jgi:hypothetical protein
MQIPDVNLLLTRAHVVVVHPTIGGLTEVLAAESQELATNTLVEQIPSPFLFGFLIVAHDALSARSPG